MAGIGLQLVKLLKQETYQSTFRALSLSTVISFGPMLFTLFSIGFICFFSLFSTPNALTTHQFLVVIINLFAGSMILSSFFQYTFFRFVADLVFIKAFERITSNFLGVLLVQLLLSCAVSIPFACYYFSTNGAVIQILLVATFCVLNLIWLSIVLLSGFKSFKKIGIAFFIGYSALMIAHAMLEKYNNLSFLLWEFLVAQSFILGLLVYAIIEHYPTKTLISFEFLKKEHFYPLLCFANFFFYLGFWADKYIFWFAPNTGNVILPPFSYSPIYDIPMMISMLSIIPATSVFTLKIEAYFAYAYPKMMEAIFKQKTLGEIELACHNIVLSGREAFFSAAKTQAFVMITLCFLTPYLWTRFNNSNLYLTLTFILIVAGGLYFMLWAVISLFYYMTKYKEAFYVSFMFCITNTLLTILSIYAGPEYYGYGVTLSLVLTVTVALILLNKNFKEILYFTFMMTD